MLWQRRAVAKPLVFRGAVWSQLTYWFVLLAGVATTMAAVVVLVKKPQGWTDGFFLVPLGLLMAAAGLLLVRIRVTISSAGVDLRLLRRLFIPAGDSKAVVPRPGPGSVGLAGAVVAVVRADGSEVRLDPTLAISPSRRQVDARMRDRIKKIYDALHFGDAGSPA